MPGGVINTGSHPKLLWPGIKDIWGQVYDEHKEEYPDLYDLDTSTKAYEEDVQVTPFGLAPVKSEGAGLAYDSEIQGVITRYMHIAYALGYIVTYEELQDNLYEIVASRRAKANAFSMRQTIENVAAFPFNSAFVTTYQTTGDGAAWVSTAHVNVTGGTYSNALTPGADLSESALEDICIQIMQTANDRGNLISIMPRCLLIPVQEWFNAHRILKSVLQPDTASNNVNVLKMTNAFPDGIKMNHYFTAPSAWFVRTNCPNGLQFFWRNKPQFDQDNDFDTKNAKASSYMRFSCGLTDPRGLFGSNGP
ncbi:MAG TPA: hypothetical protein VF077_08810 [Nitrospiraceae bacterium]